MQFFPPVQPGPVQTAQFGGMTESLETKAGQDFEDLLSEHLDQADAGSDSSSAGPSESRVEAVPAASVLPAESERGEARQEDVRADEHEASVREKQQQEQIQADGANLSQSAKPAANEKEQVHDDEEILIAAALEETVIDEDGVVAEETEKLLSELAKELEVLSELVAKAEGLASELGTLLSGAAEIKSEGHAQTRGKVEALASRIQTMQDMVRQYRQSDPAARAELAESLGMQLRTLRDDVAAFDRARNLDASISRQTVSLSSGKISSILTRIENVARRIETSGSSPHAVETASSMAPRVESRKVQSSGGMNVPEVPVKTKISHRAGSQESASRAEAQTKTSFTSPERAGDVEPQDVRTRQDSPTSSRPSQSQTQPSRPVNVQSAQPASENTPRVQTVSLEVAATSGGKQSASAVSSHVTTSGESRAVRGAQTKSPSVTGAETAQTVGVKSAAKDLSVPAGKRESGVENTAGTESVVTNLESAETKASGGRKEPRPEFFAAPDREKTAASKTATSGAGAKIVAEAESSTQAATSGLQTPIQSRLEAPVNARTLEVYRQVENGAFKNLGQGLKQLVIRLDPADLGQVSVILQVRGKEVQAVLRASSQETSQALSEQLGQLRTQLEAQGLKVSRLEVQTQLSDSQSQSEWQGAEQHNRFQENRELALSALRWRTLGQADSSLARDVQNIPQREKNSSSGLDIFA